MARRHYGEVISKTEYMSHRYGAGIVLEVATSCRGIQTFNNAAWTLRRFEVGDKVTWSSGGILAWLKDPRGTNRLEKLSEYWEQGS